MVLYIVNSLVLPYEIQPKKSNLKFNNLTEIQFSVGVIVIYEIIKFYNSQLASPADLELMPDSEAMQPSLKFHLVH